MAVAAWPFLDERWRYNDDLLRGLSNYFGTRAAARSAGVFPPLNFYDDGTALMVRAEIPGANRESLEVTSQADQLTIRGERKISTPSANANYHRREREEGQFRRVVTLPYPADAEKIRATYKNGVLEIVMPKAPEALPRQIPVN
jgi:HSP20 family protein